MTAYNFKANMASMVQDGVKRQTVRNPRKRPVQTGTVLQLYVGMRTSRCRKLRDAVCNSVLPVTITHQIIELDGRELSYAEMREFAWRDGFNFPDNLFGFFQAEYGLPTQKEVISWDIETMDHIVYAALNVTHHIKGDVGNPLFVTDLVEAGQTLWRTPSGRILSVMPWDWDIWLAKVHMLPWYVFTGIPVEWEKWSIKAL